MGFVADGDYLVARLRREMRGDVPVLGREVLMDEEISTHHLTW